MLRNKQSNLELPDLTSLPSSSVEHKIVRTIDQLGLEEEMHQARVILVGSAALALYGVELYTPNPFKPRPSDVDLAVDTALFSDLYQTRTTPSGIEVKYNKDGNVQKSFQEILDVEPDPDSDTLPVQFINRRDESKTAHDYDQGFRDYYRRNSVILPHSNGIRVASPDLIKKELRWSKTSDRKASNDYRSFLRREKELKKRR